MVINTFDCYIIHKKKESLKYLISTTSTDHIDEWFKIIEKYVYMDQFTFMEPVDNKFNKWLRIRLIESVPESTLLMEELETKTPDGFRQGILSTDDAELLSVFKEPIVMVELKKRTKEVSNGMG